MSAPSLRHRVPPSARVALLLGLAAVPWVGGSGCYDHAWVQAHRQRRAAAEAASGAEVTGGEQRRPIRYVGRVRVHVSEAFQAHHGQWRDMIEGWVEDASAVVGPTLGARLELADTPTWRPACDPAALDACLEELRALDAGQDVDWVIGLLAAQPRYTNAFDELGVATLPGRHVVLRDLSDPRERDAIDAAFPDMSAEERRTIYRRRQAHKRLVLFLHEWAHTLGGLHTRSRETLLYPSYDDSMAHFAEGNLALLEGALTDHFEGDTAHTRLRAALEAASGAQWVDGEREKLAGLLAASARPAAPPAPSSEPEHPFLVPGSQEEAVSDLAPEDRARYQRAVDALLEEELSAAWAELYPLIELYPESYAVQSFGCSLAMHLSIGQAAHTSCGRVIALASEQEP